MAVTQVGTPNATVYTTTNGTNTPSISFSGTQTDTAGDLLVLVVTAAATTSVTTPSVPAGFTQAAVSNNTNAFTGIYYKVAAGSDTVSISVTTSGTTRCGFTLFELHGQGASTGFITGTYTSGASSTIAAMGVTGSKNTPTAGGFGIAGLAREQSSAAAATWTLNGSWTNFSTDGATSTRDHNYHNYIANPSLGAALTCGGSITSATGLAAGVVLWVPQSSPPAVFNEQNTSAPPRAPIPPKPRLAGVYNGQAPPPQNPFPIGTPWTPPAADTAYGTGQIQWNAGAPVNNPNVPGPSGPPLGWSSPAGVRVVIVRTGLAMSTPIPAATVTPPSPAPFHPFNQAVRAKYLPHSPIAGTVTGSGSNGAICGSVNGAGSGSGNGSQGAPVRNPAPGPVFYPKRTPVRFILPPPHPRAGRVGSSFGAPVENPVHGPPAYPLQGPVRARVPELQPRAGRAASNAGAPVRNPTAGPVFTQAVQALRARLPLQPVLRGRSASNPGAPVHNPQPGPVFRQAPAPARARIPQVFSKGRTASNAGGPVVNPAVPVAHPRSFVKAQLPLPRRGTCRTIRFLPVQSNPQPGPVFVPADSPARARTPLPPKGRISSGAGGPLRNPVAAPAFIQKPYPARARITLPPRGRVSSGGGAKVQNPTTGPVFRQAASPARIRPALPPRGRIASSAGGPVRNPAPPGTGPVFYPRNSAKAQQPLPRRGLCRAIRFYPEPVNPFTPAPLYPLQRPVRAPVPPPHPRAGRIGSNAGGPVLNPPVPVPPSQNMSQPAGIRVIFLATGRAQATRLTAAPANPTAGPVFTQRTSPVQARFPLPPRGRVSSNAGGPLRNPVQAVLFTSKPYPARIRPALPPRGRIASSPGAPVRNPTPGPVFAQAVHPAQSRILKPWSKGRVYSNPGGPVLNPPAPVYPLRAPVRIRPSLPPRGRITSNPGTPPPPPVVPAKVYPLHGPVQARRPLPPHGRCITGNRGAPVRNPQPGPVFRQAVQPCRARAPQNAPRGRTASNPGGPVENIPFTRIRVTLGQPYTSWEAGDPYTSWLPGQPYAGWETGDPD